MPTKIPPSSLFFGYTPQYPSRNTILPSTLTSANPHQDSFSYHEPRFGTKKPLGDEAYEVFKKIKRAFDDSKGSKIPGFVRNRADEGSDLGNASDKEILRWILEKMPRKPNSVKATRKPPEIHNEPKINDEHSYTISYSQHDRRKQVAKIRTFDQEMRLLLEDKEHPTKFSKEDREKWVD
jgi:hypothetical protein